MSVCQSEASEETTQLLSKIMSIKNGKNVFYSPHFKHFYAYYRFKSPVTMHSLDPEKMSQLSNNNNVPHKK